MFSRNKNRENKKYYLLRLLIMLLIVMFSLVSYYLLLRLGLMASENGGYVIIDFNNYGEMYGEIIQFFSILMFVFVGGTFLVYMGFKELKYNYD